MTNDEQVEELLPCPFCGWDEPTAYLKGDNPGSDYWVTCRHSGCDASSGMKGSKVAAIYAWNTRAKTKNSEKCSKCHTTWTMCDCELKEELAKAKAEPFVEDFEEDVKKVELVPLNEAELAVIAVKHHIAIVDRKCALDAYSFIHEICSKFGTKPTRFLTVKNVINVLHKYPGNINYTTDEIAKAIVAAQAELNK